MCARNPFLYLLRRLKILIKINLILMRRMYKKIYLTKVCLLQYDY